MGRRYCPNLHSSIQGRRGKHVQIFWVDAQLHNIVLMVIVLIDTFPVLVPIKLEDLVIITTTQNVREGGMYNYMPDEVGVLAIYRF
jgi:hypothetical protein